MICPLREILKSKEGKRENCYLRVSRGCLSSWARRERGGRRREGAGGRETRRKKVGEELEEGNEVEEGESV